MVAAEQKGTKTGMVEKVQKNLEQKKVWKLIWDYLMITIFSFTYAAGISLFLDPNKLAPGGVSGISIMLSRITPIPTGTWILLLNIPILGLGLWKFGLKFLISTVYCTIVSSAFTNMLAGFGALTTDKVLAAAGGGALVGGFVGKNLEGGGNPRGGGIFF